MRWKFGAPPVGNANFAWVQHFIHHLAPTGVAGFVLANGSMSSNQSSEGEIRKAIVEALFIGARQLGTMIDRVHRSLTIEDIQKIAGTYHAWRGDVAQASPPASSSGVSPRGYPRDETSRKLAAGTAALPAYQDIAGFCKSAKLDEIRGHGHVLTPGRYVGAEEAEGDGEPFAQKMRRLTAKLEEQFTESAKLEKAIKANLKGLDI